MSASATRRRFLAVGSAFLGARMIDVGRCHLFGATAEYSERAVRLVRDSLVIDMLHQFLYRRDLQTTLKRWLTKPGAFTEADFDQWRGSGITAVNLGNFATDSYEEAIRYFAYWNGFIAAYPDHLLRIGAASDFTRAKQSGKLGLLFGRRTGSIFARRTMLTYSTGSASACHSLLTIFATGSETARSKGATMD
jgi:hypothetical protein